MKKALCTMAALLLLHVGSRAVTIETTDGLVVYYPQYSRIDLACGQMPQTADKTVEFCCEAAFTGELLPAFKHSNIADNHISGGVMKRGYRCRANTGGFVWGGGRWKFMPKASFPTTADSWSMGFCQLLIIHGGTARPIGQRMRNNKNIYRALCEKDGRLCIVESRQVMTYERFVQCLQGYKVTHALYLDMGAGWNYAWYRDGKGQVKEIFPGSKRASNFQYRTNWITFYK